MIATTATAPKIVYWHLELPPLSADFCGGDTIEARSGRVPGSLAHRDAAWDRCYTDLIEHGRVTIEQEVARRGAQYAHVKDEVIEAKHDDAKGETWLAGRFRYALYQGPRG